MTDEGPRMSDGGPDAGGSGDQPADGTSIADRAAEAADSDVSEWLSLEPDEEVIWVGEPTKLRMIGTVVTGIVLIPFLIGFVVLLAAPVSYLSITHTDYVVTNRSLYVKQGILSTNIESVDLDRIQNTEFTQSFWGTQLGFGTIDVSTAGSSGADLSFDDVEDAREVREQISRAQREFGGRGAHDGTGGDGGNTDRRAANTDRLDELVAELRATREALERVEARMAADNSSERIEPSSGPFDGASVDRNDASTDHGDGTDGRDDQRPGNSD